MVTVNTYPHTLQFKFLAGTSRGTLREKTTHIIKITDPSSGNFGLGECGPLKGLSVDDRSDLPSIIMQTLGEIKDFDPGSDHNGIFDLVENLVPIHYPALRFALETALIDLSQGGKRILFDNSFTRGTHPLPINGLIWMGDRSFMQKQIDEKIRLGFTCLKMKIGALDFNQELEILKYIRSQYDPELVLRVDANGAFEPEQALKKLEQLAGFNIHSIEQPLAAGQWESMSKLCLESPIAIALDEELIGKEEERATLLQAIQPQYIILKPTLLGGFRSTRAWINAAEELNIGWWITSALESNIGLNAICQFTGQYAIQLPQGLGTGGLYYNNFPSPLEVEGGYIHNRDQNLWDLSLIPDIGV